MEENGNVLQKNGIISIEKLAQELEITQDFLIEGLKNCNIPYIKLSSRHKHWLVRFEDLRLQDLIEPKLKDLINMEE